MVHRLPWLLSLWWISLAPLAHAAPVVEQTDAPSTLWIATPSKTALFAELIRLEPTARKVQETVIRYNNVGTEKIKRWHWESRLKALIPSLSFGSDFSSGNNIDLDRGSTKDPDVYIEGPEEIDRGWDLDLKWDLADLVWSTDQSTIDLRERWMVGLRQDLVAEATHLYHERRRLQTEIVFSPARSQREHFQKLIRMDELTSLLDGLTGGFFGGEIQAVYLEKPHLQELWHFQKAASR